MSMSVLVGREKGRKRVGSRKTLSLPGRSSLFGMTILAGREEVPTDPGDARLGSGVAGVD
jgi:hypothetical protein